MYDSDRKYLSRFALDPAMEYGGEDRFESDFFDDEMDLSDYDGLADGEDSIPEDGLFFED
jgi:hypothetical protein